MKQFIFSTKFLLIALWVVVGFSGGFAFGLRLGDMEGSQRTTEIRNQMLDIKPYDASLQIKDLEYKDISPSGCTVMFTTGSNERENLTCEWTIYPSDMFMVTDVWHSVFADYMYTVTIETYPEGGTLMFRILEGGLEDNRGSLWFYIDLPRSTDPNSILPPPYLPTEKIIP